jgi:twinkle protein
MKYGYRISITGLQNILLGWREGELTILSGYPGSGKSTFLNQEMLYQIEKNKLRVCILSLEMKPRVYLSWMINQYLKKKHLEDNDITKTTDDLDGKVYVIPQVGKINIDVMMDAIKYATRKYGVKLFVIDSMMRIQFDSRYENNEQKNFIDTLVGFAREWSVHIFLVVHPKKNDNVSIQPDEMDLYGTSNILNLTDNLIFLWKDEVKKRTELYSKKNRMWGSNNKVFLNFNAETRTFHEEV